MEKAPIPHDRLPLSVGDFALQALVDAMIARHDQEAFDAANQIIELNKRGDET